VDTHKNTLVSRGKKAVCHLTALNETHCFIAFARKLDAAGKTLEFVFHTLCNVQYKSGLIHTLVSHNPGISPAMPGVEYNQIDVSKRRLGLCDFRVFLLAFGRKIGQAHLAAAAFAKSPHLSGQRKLSVETAQDIDRQKNFAIFIEDFLFEVIHPA